ncbi:MAG: signal recognition particle-docking protein FtsY [Candidatus Goldiibacteriota bacterium]
MTKTDKFSRPRSFLGKIKSFFDRGDIKEYLDELEELLISADIDMDIVDEMSELLEKNKLKTYEEAAGFLKKEFEKKLSHDGAGLEIKAPLHILLLTGINGSGKTSTAAKLAWLFKKKGKKVMFAAADTFRAAAIQQLASWAEKLGVELISGMENADPASVVYDAVMKAKKDRADLLIVDTAGRLHTKKNLMQELEKIKKIAMREVAEENIDAYIIIDANTGKNAYMQAKEFNACIKLSGIVLTKFDSSAKGGSVIGIRSGLNLPVKYITFGETSADIEEFSARKFTDELFEI